MCIFVFFAQKKSILVASQNWSWATDVTWTVLPMYLLCFWTWEHFSCVAVYGESIKALRLNQKYLHLCSEDEQSSFGFGTTWGWVINDRISILGWTNPLIGSRKKREPNLQYLAYLNTILFVVFILILSFCFYYLPLWNMCSVGKILETSLVANHKVCIANVLFIVRNESQCSKHITS